MISPNAFPVLPFPTLVVVSGVEKSPVQARRAVYCTTSPAFPALTYMVGFSPLACWCEWLCWFLIEQLCITVITLAGSCWKTHLCIAAFGLFFTLVLIQKGSNIFGIGISYQWLIFKNEFIETKLTTLLTFLEISLAVEYLCSMIITTTYFPKQFNSPFPYLGQYTFCFYWVSYSWHFT